MRQTSLLITGVLGLVIVAAHAGDYRVGALDIVDPWSRVTPKGASVAAGYMKISNTGTTTDRLVGGYSDAAARFEVHEMTMDGGVMKMRPLKAGLEIKPGETVELKPGSFHIMFVDLKNPLTQGEHVKATLTFEKAGAVNVEFDVRAMGAETGQGMPGMKMPGH